MKAAAFVRDSENAHPTTASSLSDCTEKPAPVFIGYNISEQFAPKSQAHQCTEIIAVRKRGEHVLFKSQKGYEVILRVHLKKLKGIILLIKARNKNRTKTFGIFKAAVIKCFYILALLFFKHSQKSSLPHIKKSSVQNGRLVGTLHFQV